MAAAANETMSTQVSSPSAIFNDYLNRREATISLYHPQWDLTNEEISSSPALLKRDGTPICIPPSWDLIQKYVGPVNESADGTGSKTPKLCKRYSGDRVEAKFLDIFRNLKIGGVLVGDVKSEDFLDTEKFVEDDFIPMPKEARDVFEQEMKETKDFQLDFVFFHPKNGILQFEIKSSDGNESKALKQLKKNRLILKQLFFAYGKLIGLDARARDLCYERYFPAHSYIYVEKPRGELLESGQKCDSIVIYGSEQLKKFSLDDMKTTPQSFLKEEEFRGFLILIAGFRSDYFISPVKCVLLLQKNIFSNRVNTVNYYRKGDDEHKIQNYAKTVTEFLQALKFVENVEIDFGEYNNIYLTPQQQDAVGFFDGAGNFSPKRQVIVGPPGSGKSLILMLKIFILGQMESRKEQKLYYGSQSGEHTKKLAEFVSRNKSKFCREVKEPEAGEWNIVASEGADVIVDEEWDGFLALDCLSSQHEDQIVAFVCTGWSGNATSKNIVKGKINGKKLFESGQLTKFFESGEVKTFFESPDMKKFFESGQLTKLVESGELKKSLQSGEMTKFFESGQLTKFCESGEVRKFYESGAMTEFIESGYMMKYFESGHMMKFFESGKMTKFIESGTMKKLFESGYMSKLFESGYMKKFVESGEMTKFIESGEMTKFIESGEMPKLVGSIDMKKFESLGFQITELQTVFRSTQQIQSFFHKFHPDKNKENLVAGHNFDGVKVEEWTFEDGEKVKKALNERIQRLIQIEGCEEGKIGLFQPWRYQNPQVINNIFNYSTDLRSLEFPVMIVVEPNEYEIYLCLSRAICHLIIFTVIDLD